MNVKHSLEKLTIILRAELFLLKTEAKRSRLTTLIMLVSLGLIIISIFAFNAGVFFYLVENSEFCQAALLVGGGNLILAFIITLSIRFIHPSREELEIKRVSDVTKQSLSQDMLAIGDEVKGVQRIFEQLDSGLRKSIDPYSALLPVVSYLLKSLKKGK